MLIESINTRRNEMSLLKAFNLNDELVKINPERNGAAYAIGFTFNEDGDYVITYNKGEVSKIVATIPLAVFKSLTVSYLAHMYSSKVEMAY